MDDEVPIERLALKRAWQNHGQQNHFKTESDHSAVHDSALSFVPGQ
jgi:hypothetical protein